MNYTKEQLHQKIGVIIKDKIPFEDLEDTLSWKRWRVVEEKTVKSGQEDKICYSVSEIEGNRNDPTFWDTLSFLLWSTHPITSTYNLKWVKSTYLSENNVTQWVLSFETEKEANTFIQEQIVKYTQSRVTKTIVSIQPE